ncbi:MAG: glycosyltransferase family 39 protein, partial [Acidobacteria bacterium]|nr:glycosyltransferase family 39 protein [Acidobacteriota bacterium]
MKRETWSFEGGSRWRGGLALAVVLLLGALLRFHALTQKSLWEDEIFSFNALGIYRLGQPVAPPASLAYNAIAYYHDDNHPPFFFLLFGIWLKLFGASALAARSLPALINLATLPFFYLLARRIFKETLTALAACFIFGFSAYLVGYSQEARMYPLVLLFSVLSMLFFVAMEQGGDWRSHVGFILASVLGLYTHYYFAFLICFQIVYWFFYGGVRFRAFFLDLCAIGLG